jgi:molybdopterin biosynthesis enzyme
MPERNWTFPAASRQAAGMAESLRQQQDKPVSLTDALAAIDRSIDPVRVISVDLSHAAGLTLAEDAVVAGTKVRLAGARLRRIDLAQLRGAGIESIEVRVPRFLIVPEGVIESTRMMIEGAIESEGGAIAEAGSIETAIKRDDFDALIVFGNQRIGKIILDGVALSPGGALAYGHVGGRSLFAMSSDFGAALAGWLAIGRRVLARLAFRLIEEQPYLLELARPVASTRGIAQIVAVRRRAAQLEPLPDDWTAETMARSDGWILIPADSEGLAAGTRVQMRPWP